MSNSPPPYSEITGISRSVMKDNNTETLANYDGNARPGELVVNLESNPPEVYVGNNNGYLTLVSNQGTNISNGTSRVDIPTINDNVVVTAGVYSSIFDTEGGFKPPIRTSAPSSPVIGAYYTCDGYLWNPAGKPLMFKPYPVFYDGTDYIALY